MSRVDSVLELIRAEYAGAVDTKWYFGPVNDGRHDNAERIVHSVASGRVVPPRMGCFAEDRRDRVVANRDVTINSVIMARDETRAENRLHALILAIMTVGGQAEGFSVSVGSEVWSPKGAASSGVQVTLTWVLSLLVLQSDAAVVASDAAPGEGVPTVAATSATINPYLSDSGMSPVEVL